MIRKSENLVTYDIFVVDWYGNLTKIEQDTQKKPKNKSILDPQYLS